MTEFNTHLRTHSFLLEYCPFWSRQQGIKDSDFFFPYATYTMLLHNSFYRHLSKQNHALQVHHIAKLGLLLKCDLMSVYITFPWP